MPGSDPLQKKARARQVLLLTASTIIVKLAGLFFKIPLTALIGEAGMGYFNSAYTLFTWFYMVSTAGLPVAETMLISGARARNNSAQIKRVLRLTMLIFLLLGVVGSGVMLLGAGFFASLMRVERSKLSMMAIAPTLVFICQSAALRGYFQGLGELAPHAVSQVAEALGKLFLGIALAKYALGRGEPIEAAAAYAALGLAIGVAAGTLVLYLSLLFVRESAPGARVGSGAPEPTKRILNRLVLTAVPITLSAGLSSFSGLLDSVVMTRRLHDIGLSQLDAAAIWGNYSSLALPMFNLPPVLIYPLVYALMPELTSLLAENKPQSLENARERCKKTLMLTAAISLPCALGMAALAEPILALFFDAQLARRGAGMLATLAPSSFLVCLLALTNTMLQACGRERDPLWAMLAGAAVKLASAWTLIPILGKYGTPVSTFLSYLVCVGISIGCIESKTPLTGVFGAGIYIRWFAAALIAVTAAAIAFPLVGTIPAIMIAVGAYALICGVRIIKLLKGN